MDLVAGGPSGMNGSFARRVVTIGTTLSCVRIGIFSVLVYAEWTGRQSISLVPLILGLYPEALIADNDVAWTMWAAIGFGVLLIGGSFLLALLLAVIPQLARRRP